MNKKIKRKSFLNLGEEGLTLIELLVVVFILSALSLGAVSLINNSDSQFRYEDTKTRLFRIRMALLGDPALKSNEQRLVSGFICDIGRIPLNIQELITNTVGVPIFGLTQPIFDPTPAVDGFSNNSGDEIPLNADSEQLFKGYRGPYLQIPAGSNKYRDGWGNQDSNLAVDNVNFGWDVTAVTPVFDVVSFGSDGILGGAGEFKEDLPEGVVSFDWEISVEGWSVSINNLSAAAINNVRASIIVFQADSAGATKWKRISSNLIASIAPATSQIVTFPVGSGSVAIGQHLLLAVSDDQPILNTAGTRVSKRVSFYPKASIPEFEIVIQ